MVFCAVVDTPALTFEPGEDGGEIACVERGVSEDAPGGEGAEERISVDGAEDEECECE